MTPNQLINDLINDFISFLASRKKSPYTIVAYKKDLLQLSEFLVRVGKSQANEVTTIDLEGFLNELAEKNYTAKSIARKLNAIKGFFRWLRNRSIIPSDPALPVPHPKYELSTPRVLSILEYRALRDASRNDSRTRAIIEILLQTGMRISEVAALKLSDIRKNEIELPGRTIPLNNAAKQAIDDYLKVRQENLSPHLFITKTGRPLLVRNIRSGIERYFGQAGIDGATVNDLRNTFIIHQLLGGVDLLTISGIVGHKRLTTTERYLGLIKEKTTSRHAGLAEL